MTRYLVFLSIVLALVAVVCPSVFGLARSYDLDRPVSQSDWPAGLANLLNSQKPVHAYFVNFQDIFFYSGDSSAFNAFMERYGKLEGIPHTLVLHCGKAETRDKFQGEKMESYDWDVLVDRISQQEYLVTVHLFLGGNVKLSEIKASANVKVESGGEIEKFIKKHEAQSADVAADGGEFGIYLLADEKMNADGALRLRLDELTLQKEPLLTPNDFVCYSWKDHSFKLTPEATVKLPKPQVFGVPFVVMVNGQRIYLGAFWTHASSASFPNPVICTDPFLLPSESNRYTIDRNYAAPDLAEDPRDSPAVRAVFQAAGKLDACGDDTRQPNAETSGPPVAGSVFGIYLLADENMNAIDALKMKLDEIPLQNKPLFTLDDFVCYSWEDHWFKLTPEALKRLPKIGKPPTPQLRGVPFVVLVDGRPIYLGAFWTWISSLSFPNPVIIADEMWLPAKLHWLTIDRAYPGATEEQYKDDIRKSPLLRNVLETAGKFDACAGIQRPPSGGFSSTVQPQKQGSHQ